MTTNKPNLKASLLATLEAHKGGLELSRYLQKYMKCLFGFALVYALIFGAAGRRHGFPISLFYNARSLVSSGIYYSMLALTIVWDDARGDAYRLLDSSALVEERKLRPLVEHAANFHSLDPKLVTAVILVESGFRTKAISPQGALGLMQLMPDTARLVGVTQPFDPADNVNGGARYLKEMLQRFSGNLELALAAYNAGPSAVDNYDGIPPYPETIRYVQRVKASYQLLREMKSRGVLESKQSGDTL